MKATYISRSPLRYGLFPGLSGKPHFGTVFRHLDTCQRGAGNLTPASGSLTQVKQGMCRSGMMKRPALTALCVALFFAGAASAEPQGSQNHGGSASDARLRYVPQVSAGPAAPPPAPNSSLFEGARPGLGLSRQTYSEQDGSVAVRSGFIGTVPLAKGVSAGLGLFSVTHEDQKSPEFRRSWTPKAVGPRDRRVAAFGLNVRF